jgi:CRP-like cAMP-binding protein
MAAVIRSSEDAGRLFTECNLFRGLSKIERLALASRSQVREYTAGETIFLMGSSGNSMMAVLRGAVKISIPSADGKEIILAILQQGEVFGEIALLDGKERTADAKAMSACKLAILERQEVLKYFERNPQAWPKLVEILCERLRQTDQQFAEVALLQLPARLAKALLRFVDVQAASQLEGSKGEVELSQRELGNIVGATRESVNKCLHDWQRLGIIRIEENVIVIANRAALEKLTES